LESIRHLKTISIMSQQKSVSFQDMAEIDELNEMTDELKIKQV
jgi:hypothetical protein